MSEENEEREPTWSRTMGIEFVRTTADEVIAELVVGPQHRQAFGLIHGGVHCGLIESVASMGATIVTRARGQPPPVGLENHTSFVKAAREGKLRATATPIHRGRTTQLWEATVRDEQGRVVASGRVRFACTKSDSGEQPLT